MKSIDVCEMRYGEERKSKIKSKSKNKGKGDNTSSRQLKEGDSMRSKETEKGSTTENDSVCDIEICEVVGNVRDGAGDKNSANNSGTSEGGRSLRREKADGEARKEENREEVDGSATCAYNNSKRDGKRKRRELLLNVDEEVPPRESEDGNSNGLVNNIKNSGWLASSWSPVQSSGTDVENSLGECKRKEEETNASSVPASDDPGDDWQMQDSVSPCERLIENNSGKSEEEVPESYADPSNADETAGGASPQKEVSELYRGDEGSGGGTFIGGGGGGGEEEEEEENKENETSTPKREGNRKARHKKDNTPNQSCQKDSDSLTSVWESENDDNSQFYSSNENNIQEEEEGGGGGGERDEGEGNGEEEEEKEEEEGEEEEEEGDEGDDEDGVIICEVNVEETDTLDYDKNMSLTDSGKTEESDISYGQEGKNTEGKNEERNEEAEDSSNRKRFHSEIADEEGVVEKKRKTSNEEEEENSGSIGYPRRILLETDDAGEGNCDGFRGGGGEEEEKSIKLEGNESSLPLKSCINDKTENFGNEEGMQHSLPFVETLRDSIKTLSKGDLEELVVQKLCEVITERSNVGLLRKKAEALEQDQERWKEKVQSLTKQIREMDMVMKKYMSEVSKQNKERNFQMVAPLRVTRSVGLQVSFTSNSSKMSKGGGNGNQRRNSLPSSSSSSSSSQNQDNTVKQPQQHAVYVPQNTKKNVAILPAGQVQMSPGQKKQYSPRSGVNFTFQARLITPQNIIPQNRGSQPQVNPVIRPKPPLPDQNNSKIIDLTEDDDRQSNQLQNSPKAVLQPSVSVRPPGQIRVVNHIQPGQVNSGSRVAYLVPAPSTTPGGSVGSPQSRQLLIATPAVSAPPRHILPSVPPLLYKGSTILQPGTQQPAIISQSNRAVVPKSLKHPAPLPQPPQNQIQKPNWKLLPPRPALKISKVHTGIVLSWNMTLGPEYEPIASYQLYAYQENNCPPATSLWKKVGDVKALPLPMACTLTQFMSGHKYYFAVRAVDLHSRIGPFSFPGSIVLIK